MASGAEGDSLKRSDSYNLLPPNLSELRVVLLGNSWRQKTSVGNLLLGKTEFTQHHKCAKGSKAIRDKTLTVVIAPDVLRSTTSSQLHQITQDIKSLSAPGPHVFLLVLQPEDFTEQHSTRLQSVLESFSEQAFHHSLVLLCRPREETQGFMDKYMSDPHIRDMISKCSYRFHWMHNNEDDQNSKEFERKKLLNRIGQILKENKDENLRPGSPQEEDTDQTNSIEQKPSLNLVLCGRPGAEKSSAAESILRRAGLPAESSPGQCVQHQGEVCGRWVSVVELPALSGKPLEAVMQQSLSCLSLCGPEGVHAFILVLPLGPLTDEDKAEIKTIQDTFSSAVNPFTMILFTVDSDPTAPAVVDSVKADTDLQELCQSCGGGYLIFNTRGQQQVSELLESVETLKATNKPHSYTTERLVQGQREMISALQKELQQRGGQKTNDLRITLIGKTGTGKSSSGNTILGKEEFFTKLSQISVTKECKKAEAEVDGRLVAVVDTPGLFDTTVSAEEGNEEKLKCISLLAPGPHVFLLVLQIGRLTPEEQSTLKLIKKGFGKDIEKFTIVLLTHGDKLENDGLSVEEYIRDECEKSFKDLISSYNNRYHVFNNRKKKDSTQVKELMRKIDDLVTENGGSCYTNDLLLEAEVDIKKELPKILKEKERERGEMVRKHKEDMEEMTQKINKLKEKIDKEAKGRSVIERKLQQSKAQMEEERQKWETEKKESEKILVNKHKQQMEEIKLVYAAEDRTQAEELDLIKKMLQIKENIEQKQEEMQREKEMIQKSVTEKMEQILNDRQQRRKELIEKEEKIMETQ